MNDFLQWGGGVTLGRKINDQQGRNVNVSNMFSISVQYSVFHHALVISDHTFLCSCFPQPRPTRGRMRIHCLENVDKALQFLKEQRVHLENVGSHDIVDGNHRLTLGLIWTIILRFQVERIKRTEPESCVVFRF